MKPTAAANPTDLTFDRNPLCGLVMLLLVLLGGLTAENKRLRTKVADLEAALKLERAKRFGRSSERSPAEGKFSPASWVKFLLDKYQFQLPLARQVKQLAQIGLPMAESTLHARRLPPLG